MRLANVIQNQTRRLRLAKVWPSIIARMGLRRIHNNATRKKRANSCFSSDQMLMKRVMKVSFILGIVFLDVLVVDRDVCDYFAFVLRGYGCYHGSYVLDVVSLGIYGPHAQHHNCSVELPLLVLHSHRLEVLQQVLLLHMLVEEPQFLPHNQQQHNQQQQRNHNRCWWQHHNRYRQQQRHLDR